MSHSKNKPFAKRSLGQNFLVDETVVGNIVSELQLNVGDTLIEIGPGRGALTEKLVATGAKVIAIEIDRNFVPSLRAQFHFDRNFSVIEADVLNVGITEIATDSDRGSVKLVG
ncbi:MAG: rRNA adenine N-6-methyltransferase family protein, partial [Pyrinomonadaceae bacterium]